MKALQMILCAAVAACLIGYLAAPADAGGPAFRGGGFKGGGMKGGFKGGGMKGGFKGGPGFPGGFHKGRSVAYRSIYNNTLSRTGSVRTLRPGAFDAGYTRKTFYRRGRGIDAVNFPTFFGGVGGFGGYGGFGLSPYSLGQVPVPPYFALHPPVYYSAPVPRSYGYSPYAYPGRIVTPEAPVPVVPEVIENAFCPTAVEKLKAQDEATKEAANDVAATQEWVQNPYVQADPKTDENTPALASN